MPTEVPQPSMAESIDLRTYWRTVMRRRWVLVGTFIGVMVLSAAYTLRLPKIYSAQATIIIEMASPKILGNGQVQDVAESSSPAYWYSKEYYETQYNVLRSRAVADRVAHIVRTARDDKFLGLDRVEKPEAREKGLKALAAFRQQLAGLTNPSNAVLGRVQVEPVKDSRVVKLSVEDQDPLMAAGLANAFSAAYMEQNLASKSFTTNEATESLELRLPELDDKVASTAQALSEFKAKHSISTSFEEMQKLIGERVARLNEELTQVRIRKANLRARNDAVTAVKNAKVPDEVARAALVPEALANNVHGLKLKLIDAKNECQTLEERMLPEHPKLKDCRSRLTNLEQAFNGEVDTVLARAQAEYANVAHTEQNLMEELSAVKGESQQIAGWEPEYLKLKRAHETNQRLYEVALKSLKETDLTGTTRLNNVNILDSARPSLLSTKPNVRMNLLLGALMGLVLGLLLTFLVDVLDNTIATHEQIEERLGLPFLGIVPSIANKADHSAHDLIVHEQPKSAVAECCRAIRTNLFFMSPERPLKSILITSAGPRDGKTTTAASLAITMSESGHRVLLVDADLRRPRVHSAFKVPNGMGLSSLILGEGRLMDTVKSSGVPNLWLLTCGPVPPNPAELLHTDNFRSLLAQMVSNFDRVIIDSPPVGAVADAIVVSTQVDGTVLVVKSGVTSRDVAKRTVRALRDVKARLFGAVLNDIDLQDRQAGGYYYYYSKYGYHGDAETKGGSAPST